MAESLSDIAQKLNVAPSTVSRAISSPDMVAPKTRQRILEYIEKTGYRINLSARNLRKQKSVAVGIVVNDLKDSLLSAAADIMQDIASRRGYFPVLLSCNDSRTKEREALEFLLNFNICGLVIIPSSATAEILKDLGAVMPVAELDRSTGTYLNDEYRMDDAAGMRMAADHLIENGCRNIAVILGNIRRISSFNERYRALEKCSTKAVYYPFFISGVGAEELNTGARYLVNCMLRGRGENRESLDFSAEEADSSCPLFKRHLSHEVLKSLLLDSSADILKDPEIPFDGIITANHSLAAGAVSAFYDAGSERVKNVRLFTFDNPDWLSLLPFPVASISHPMAQAAALAVNRLLDRVEGKCSEPKETRLLKPEILPVQSDRFR